MFEVSYNADVLYNRAFEVTVDDISMNNMDLSFNITKTKTKEPNTCSLKIFNLSPWTQSELAETSNPGFRIKAGYKPTKDMQAEAINANIPDDEFSPETAVTALDIGNLQNFSTLFLGEANFIFSDYDPPNWVTSVSAGDGLRAVHFSRINTSFGAGTNFADIIRKVVGASGLGPGNLESKAVKLINDRLGRTVNGYTASGGCMRELERLCRSAGFEYSIQGGKLQFLDLGEAISGEAIVVSAATGMVGSPTISNEALGTKRKKATKKTKSKIFCRSLLNSRIVPGAQVVIQSKVFAEDKRIIVDKCVYNGETTAKNWFVSFEGNTI